MLNGKWTAFILYFSSLYKHSNCFTSQITFAHSHTLAIPYVARAGAAVIQEIEREVPQTGRSVVSLGP